MCKWMKSMVKKFNEFDIALIKLSVFFLTLFMVTVWPAFANLVFSIQWYWFLIIGLVLVAITLKHATCTRGKKKKK